MSRNRSRSLVRVKYGPDVNPPVIEEFKRKRGRPKSPLMHPTPGLVAHRVEAFVQTVNDVVPTGTTVSIWPAINIGTTLAYVAPDQYGPDAGTTYTLDRGANTVTAKTLRRDDGTFDIVVDGNWFINRVDDSDRDLERNSQLLAHLAAHEPQHIVLKLAGLDDSELANVARGESATVNDFLPGTAEAVNEFRCELAANRIATSPYPHDALSIGDDLAKFRESLATSVDLADSDRWTACVTVMTAAKELLKAVAYAAAFLFYDGGNDRSAPNPLPECWDRYMAGLWPDLLEIFAGIPAADEPVDPAALGKSVYVMSRRTALWLQDIGVTYLVEEADGEWRRSCWWDVQQPI